jgi:hypothetical protein
MSSDSYLKTSNIELMSDFKNDIDNEDIGSGIAMSEG